MEAIVAAVTGVLGGWYLYFFTDSIPSNSISIYLLIVASLTVLIPLYFYIKKRALIFLAIGSVFWIGWGFLFTIAIWI